MSANSRVLVLFFLGALSQAGCSDKVPAPREPLLRDGEELSRSAPDVRARSSRTWYVEKTPALGAYLIELDGLSPLERRRSALRIFVLSGDVRIRVGGRERLLGAGGYASIPPRMPYRLLREGRRSVRYMAFLAPDSVDRMVLEASDSFSRPAAAP